jgi:hypothetical protein
MLLPPCTSKTVHALTSRPPCCAGVWKTAAATLNLLGLALTTASHGAFLIQLTTLIVPLAQGISGVPIARQIWAGEHALSREQGRRMDGFVSTCMRA